MKFRKVMILSLAIMLMGVSGCSSSEEASDNSNEASVAADVEANEEIDINEGSQFDDDSIVDLTTLSSTMLYSEVYNMMQNPSDYIGKEVKAKGIYQSMELGEEGNRYFFILISDASECCEQGLEFICDHAVYPNDYPEEGAEVTIKGTYELYNEGENTYYRIAVDGVDNIG
ncbi:MAG: hypothetical protein ACK5LL_13675 [Suipraeoptans sp.]